VFSRPVLAGEPLGEKAVLRSTASVISVASDRTGAAQ